MGDCEIAGLRECENAGLRDGGLSRRSFVIDGAIRAGQVLLHVMSAGSLEGSFCFARGFSLPAAIGVSAVAVWATFLFFAPIVPVLGLFQSFCVSRYEICEKWLKDRTLDYVDIYYRWLGMLDIPCLMMKCASKGASYAVVE